MAGRGGAPALPPDKAPAKRTCDRLAPPLRPAELAALVTGQARATSRSRHARNVAE